MNINSVDNSFNWSGTRKTETIFSKAGSFASKLNAAKKSKLLEVGGLDSYKNLYEYSKAATDVDVNKSQHFQDYRKFLEILEQLKV